MISWLRVGVTGSGAPLDQYKKDALHGGSTHAPTVSQPTMFVPRALVLTLAALVATVAAAPSLEARTVCTAPGWPGTYTCQGACCVCDAAGNPGCLEFGKCNCAA